jgi:hypothetical protein
MLLELGKTIRNEAKKPNFPPDMTMEMLINMVRQPP